jgi:ribosome-binding protein aMBF1 (putative translation factor)
MPSFKHKTNKKIILDEKSITTLDSKHKEIEKEFEKEKTDIIPDLRAKKRYFTKLLETNLPIDQQLEIKDKLLEITAQIKELKTNKKKYYLNNNKYIFDYFETKKSVSMDNNKTKLLNSFFKIKSEEEVQHSNENKDNIQKYLSNLDESFIDITKFVFETDICQFCKKGELIPIDHEGIMVCNNCYKHIPYLVENEKPSYKEPPKEACFYAYKRINHFREILAQFQAKETTQIPEDVLENIKNQIKKERIDLKNLSNKKAKEILKKLGYNKYYEHIPFIKDKLGIKPPVMTPELEESLCNLFMEIQAPYAKFCPDDRVNFLNYYYTVYKLCELLDQTQFLPYFPMLKDREKRIEQDEIWKKICEELNWEFIPTI